MKLEKNKLIVKKKLSSTNNYVIFASRFATALTLGKEKNRITSLTQDIYKNRKKIVLSIFILEHLLIEIEKNKIYDCNELFKYINSTTFIYRKNQGYKYFRRLYKLNNKNITREGLEIYENMKSRIERNSIRAKYEMKYIEKGIENLNIKRVDYDTLLTRHIHISLNGNFINIYFFDIENNYTATKVGEYIKDAYTLITDTLNIESNIKCNIYICIQSEIKQKKLSLKIDDIQRIVKTNSYINESDFLLEKIKIHIIDYRIHNKYFNGKNLISLLN